MELAETCLARLVAQEKCQINDRARLREIILNSINDPMHLDIKKSATKLLQAIDFLDHKNNSKSNPLYEYTEKKSNDELLKRIKTMKTLGKIFRFMYDQLDIKTLDNWKNRFASAVEDQSISPEVLRVLKRMRDVVADCTDQQMFERKIGIRPQDGTAMKEGVDYRSYIHVRSYMAKQRRPTAEGKQSNGLSPKQSPLKRGIEKCTTRPSPSEMQKKTKTDEPCETDANLKAATSVEPEMPSNDVEMTSSANPDTKLVPVFFDLEVNEFWNTEILQISAKRGKPGFNCYILPENQISSQKTALTGLKKVDGQMTLHGVPVPTVTAEAAATLFLTYLKEFRSRVVLVAHDMRNIHQKYITRFFNKLGLFEEFCQTVFGFADSLPVLKKAFPGRETYKLSDLVAGETKNVHNAKEDCASLEALIIDQLKCADSIINDVQTPQDAVLEERCRRSLKPLKDRISEDMTNTLVTRRISMKTLQSVNRQENEGGVASFLSDADIVDGKPRLTENENVLDDIALFLHDNSDHGLSFDDFDELFQDFEPATKNDATIREIFFRLCTSDLGIEHLKDWNGRLEEIHADPDLPSTVAEVTGLMLPAMPQFRNAPQYWLEENLKQNLPDGSPLDKCVSVKSAMETLSHIFNKYEPRKYFDNIPIMKWFELQIGEEYELLKVRYLDNTHNRPCFALDMVKMGATEDFKMYLPLTYRGFVSDSEAPKLKMMMVGLELECKPITAYWKFAPLTVD